MENYEDNIFEADVIPSPEIPQQKASPFADSPYVMNHAPQPSAPAPKAKKSSGKKVLKTVVSAVLIVALIATGCGITAFSVNSYWQQKNIESDRRMNQLQQQLEALKADMKNQNNSGNSVSGTPNQPQSDGMTPAQIYAQNVQTVVAVNNHVTTNVFGQVTEKASSGSGFIISENGYVVSNHHVVEGAGKLTVIMYDGTEYEATLIGSDESNDIALLKVNAAGLPYVKIGSSSDLIIGDQVAAIGNPLGELTSTLTVGYISAKDRDITTDGSVINMLQTDAAINPGNSGGPLFNMKGEVIGIITAKYSGTTSSGASIEGIGFAIPMDDVATKLQDLMHYGYITGAYLGVEVLQLDAETLSSLGLPMGVYVRNVTDGYCAKEAGVRSTDVITALGSYKVDSYTALTRALQKFKAGDTTTITVWRAGEALTLDITLDEKPQSTATPNPAPTPQGNLPENGSAEDWYQYYAPFFGW